MIGIDIRGKEYQACSEWKDLTLEKFIELSEVEIPEKLERLWVASAGLNTDGKKEKKKALIEYEKAGEVLTEADIVKHFPTYYGKVMEVLTDISQWTISRTSGEDRTLFFEGHLRAFVLSLVYSAPVVMKGGKVEIYQPPEVTSFKLAEEEYFFPKSMKLFGDFIPMSEEKVISFTEAADIDLAISELRNNGVGRLPIFMGIYCRKEGEEYDETVALKRAEMFKEVDMSMVWSLFFYTVQLTAISQDFIQTYFLHRVAETAKATTKAADSAATGGEE